MKPYGAPRILIALALLIALPGACAAPPAERASSAATPASASQATSVQASAPAASVPFAPTTPPTPPAPRESVVFGIPERNLNYIVPIVASQKGFFDEAGVDVEILALAPNLMVAAMQRGDMQISGAGGSALRATARGAGAFRSIAYLTAKPTFYLVTSPEVREAAHLRDRRVAVESIGDSQMNFVSIYLRQRNVDPGQTVFIAMGPGAANRLSALHVGAVDGAVFDPAATALAEQQGLRMLQASADILPMPLQGLVVSDDYAQQKRPAITAFLKGIVRGLVYAKQQPAEVATIARQELGLDMDQAIALRGVQLYLDNVSAESPGYADDRLMEGFYTYDIRHALELAPDHPLPKLHDFSMLLEAYDALGIRRPVP